MELLKESTSFTLILVFSIIDKYVSREFLKYFFSAILVFTVLYVVVDLLSNLGRYDVESSVIVELLAYQLPWVIYMMTPVACLVATIFTVSILSRSNELVALFSSGISLARVTAPILVITSGIVITSFFVSDRLIPAFTRKKNYVMFVKIKKNPSLYYTVKTNKIWYRSKDLIYNIKTFDPDKNTVQGLSIYYFTPNWDLLQITAAKEAQYLGENWHLTDGTVTLFPSDQGFPQTQAFKNKTISLEERPRDIKELDTNKDIMTVGELKRYIRKNKEAGLDTTRYEVAYHGKFSFAFVSFVMAFLGIPFSVSRDKSGSFALNVGICLGLVLIYWTFQNIGISLGNHGTLAPLVAAWAANGLMLIVAVYFLLRLKR